MVLGVEIGAGPGDVCCNATVATHGLTLLFLVICMTVKILAAIAGEFEFNLVSLTVSAFESCPRHL